MKLNKKIILILSLIVFYLTTQVDAKELDDWEVKTDTLNYGNNEVIKVFNKSDPIFEFGNVVIKNHNDIVFKFENAGDANWQNFYLVPLLGKNEKQLIIFQYSGGAHCCFFYYIFNSSDKLELIYDSQNYSVGYELNLIDVDSDNIYEFTQTLLTFDYFEGSHAGSPFPKVLFKYDKAQNKYIVANNRYPEVILQYIKRDESIVESSYKNLNLESLKENKQNDYFREVLNVVIQYIYAGKEDAAWEFYNKWYNFSDRDNLKLKIKQQLNGCQVYNDLKGTQKVGVGQQKDIVIENATKSFMKNLEKYESSK